MCLIVFPGCKPEIAQEDITCWKTVIMFGDKWVAPIRRTSHNYDEVLTACDRLSMKPWQLFHVIEEGFHAYGNIDDAEYKVNLFKTRTLVECTIPKGAEYCLGANDEIVANKLIVHKPKTE